MTAFTTNNTFAYDELVLQDAQNTVLMSELIGGTLLKVLLQVEYDVSYAANNSTIGFDTVHSGVFLAPTYAPEENIWSPNVPHGDFMTRQTIGVRVVQGNEAADANSIQEVWGGSPGVIGHQQFIETNVKRRIEENDRLYISYFNFLGSPVTQMDIGFTGRVLVRLP